MISRPSPFSGGRPLIDAYGEGGFRLAGQRFEGSVLLTPQGLYPWPVRLLAETTEDMLLPLIESAGDCDFLLVGRGTGFEKFPENIENHLATEGLVPDLMSTGAAVRTYNVLLAEDRRVAAALLAVE